MVSVLLIISFEQENSMTVNLRKRKLHKTQLFLDIRIKGVQRRESLGLLTNGLFIPRSNGIYYVMMKGLNGRHVWISTGSRNCQAAEIIMNDCICVLSKTIRILYFVVWRGKSRLSTIINLSNY